MKLYKFASTTQGLPVWAYEFGATGPEVLILGGVHGDEPEGICAAHGLLETFLKDESLKSLNLKITLIPAFNPEGALCNQRTNSNGVDLNRNLPTKDWTQEAAKPRYNPGPSPNSELENQALVKFLKARKPVWLLTLHSWFPILNVNGSCLQQAELLAQHTGYKVSDDIGYPTPGSLGTYAGIESNIPTLTYEIERDLAFSEILKIHVPAILESLKLTETLHAK
jgi:protein MpaA